MKDEELIRKMEELLDTKMATMTTRFNDIEKQLNEVQAGSSKKTAEAAIPKPDEILLTKMKTLLEQNLEKIKKFPEKGPEKETQDEKMKLVEGQIEGWQQIQALVQEALKNDKINEETKEKIARLPVDATLTDLINQRDAIDGYGMKKLKEGALNRIKDANEQIK